jgi:hypothetical protein
VTGSLNARPPASVHSEPSEAWTDCAPKSAGPLGRGGVRKPSIAQARGLEADIVTVAGFNEVSGRMAAASVLGRRNRPSAFFAANDLMAIGAMAALRDAGVAVPRDAAVMASTTSSSPASFLRA